MVEAGLVLMDLSLRVLGCDKGALAIINRLPKGGEPTSWIPKEFLDSMRSGDSTSVSPATSRIRMGLTEYSCRASLIAPKLGFSTEPIVAIHLETVQAASDSLDEIAAKYSLTEREKDVLSGITKGLRTKELAASLNISPNTVKAFLRLVMIKMGASSRAAIVSKIFRNATNVERYAATAETRPAKRLAS